MSNPDISIVINCHHEGRLLEPTIQSINACIEIANKAGLNTELIIAKDSPDSATTEYVKNHAPAIAKIYDVNFSDVATTRNFAAGIAAGKYISFIDGDDLWNSNWLIAAYTTAEKVDDLNCILHSEVAILFEGSDHIWYLYDHDKRSLDERTLLTYNTWTVSTFARKDIYLRNPYSTINISNGFGHEDWHWNCETIANGIKHILVPNTLHCYRVKSWKESMHNLAQENNCITTSSKLFALNYQKNK